MDLRYQVFYVQILFILFSPDYLLNILTKFEASSCYSFWNILITKFNYDPLKGALLHKGR